MRTDWSAGGSVGKGGVGVLHPTTTNASEATKLASFQIRAKPHVCIDGVADVIRSTFSRLLGTQWLHLGFQDTQRRRPRQPPWPVQIL